MLFDFLLDDARADGAQLAAVGVADEARAQELAKVFVARPYCRGVAVFRDGVRLFGLGSLAQRNVSASPLL
jgi:hypothetical protein